MKLIKPYGVYFSKLFVHYNQLMNAGPFVRKGSLLFKLPEGAQRSDFDLSEKPSQSVGEGALLSSEKPSTPVLSKIVLSMKENMMAHVKSRISQAVKSMKMYINFNPEYEHNFE